MTDSHNVNRLEGSAPIAGGLVVRKKTKPSTAGDETSKNVSLFGLDKLAGKQEFLY